MPLGLVPSYYPDQGDLNSFSRHQSKIPALPSHAFEASAGLLQAPVSQIRLWNTGEISRMSSTPCILTRMIGHLECKHVVRGLKQHSDLLINWATSFFTKLYESYAKQHSSIGFNEAVPHFIAFLSHAIASTMITFIFNTCISSNPFSFHSLRLSREMLRLPSSSERGH